MHFTVVTEEEDSWPVCNESNLYIAKYPYTQKYVCFFNY